MGSEMCIRDSPLSPSQLELTLILRRLLSHVISSLPPQSADEPPVTAGGGAALGLPALTAEVWMASSSLP